MIVYVDKPKTKYYNSAMKRLILPILIIVVALAALLAACTPAATVTQVEVAEMPTKSTYYVGEDLDVTGCTINVIYSDRSVRTVDVTADMVSGMETTGIGAKTVLITYTEHDVRYTTTMVLRVVSRPASRLRVVTPPAKTDYVDGQPIDLSGLTVEAVYTEQQTVLLALSDLSYTATTATVGMDAVRVGFANLTIDIPITVQPVRVVGIDAQAREGLYRNQWVSAELFDVWYIYNNGITEQARGALLQEENMRYDATGNQTLHFTCTHPTYGDFSCTTQVEVQEDTVQSVTLRTAPLLYEEGAAFRWRDVYLDVHFAHSDVAYHMGEDVYAGLTLDVADGTTLAKGLHILHVCLGEDVLAEFRVGVGEVVPVRWHVVGGEDEVVTCVAGAVPTPILLVLYAVMSDGTEVLVWNRFAAAAGVEVTLPEAAEVGQTAASIGYDGMTYTYRIYVNS